MIRSGLARGARTFMSFVATPAKARPVVYRAAAVTTLVACAACTHTSARTVSYAPHVRQLTVTTVPLLVQEQRKLFPFLAAAFAKGGVLDGKEVYAFSPSTLTVIAGDTIHFTFINPEDDVHSFVLPDFAVSLPGNHITKATYVARRAGIYPIECAIQSHLPMMTGQLVVLSPTAVADSSAAPNGKAGAAR